MTFHIRLITLLFLALGMFLYPQEILTAASGGISLWWRFVLPALLPFFILSELLMAAGIVHFLGVMLEPLMRPLFRLPGKASFVVAMGYTSGFPMGAVLTARLRDQGYLNREEGERLLAFTNNPSPGFMFGAVASGMLGQPHLGIVLALSVYIANLLVGLIFRFYRPSGAGTNPPPVPASLRKAWQEMQLAQKADSRPLGQLLSDAIRQSITTVLAVGGFMAFFAVIIRILTLWHITQFISTLLNPLTGSFFPPTTTESILNGFLELTLGCQGVIQVFSHLNQQVGILVFLMGWGGLSVFAQVAGFTARTDLRFPTFVIARILHAFIALGLSQVILPFAKLPAGIPLKQHLGTSEIWINTWHLSSQTLIVMTVIFLAFLLIQRVYRNLS